MMDHKWIVLGEERGKIKLISKSSEKSGILPKGSFLTIEESRENKYILRVDESYQDEPYKPSPLLADMDLSPLKQDQKCQNIVLAYRIHDISSRTDGLIDYIKPQSIARRSNQSEINLALESQGIGPKVFVATVYSGKNQILKDEQDNPIIAHLPIEMFYHQMLVCGKTGSGKTVATKYLAQYFVEELENNGAVLAINVKDVDFLKMDKQSYTLYESIKKEWASLNVEPHGIKDFMIYWPANTFNELDPDVNRDLVRPITLNVDTINPDALSGLLLGISEVGAQHLPNIFRFWQERERRRNREYKFADFVRYFGEMRDQSYTFDTLNVRGDPGVITLPYPTWNNIFRNLDYAAEFFDNENADQLSADDILIGGKMSVINVAGSKGIQFGSIILRHLLKEIVERKNTGNSTIPILIIIDEVHYFYSTTSSKEALGELDTICRTGRSKEIGVIFSSQNPSDIPRGLSNVINTKIFFKSDSSSIKDLGVKVSDEEMQSLKAGYALGNIHNLSQLKVVKFPLSLSGVFEKG